MLMPTTTGCFCAGLYQLLVLHFLNGACLFKMVRKALLKSIQASSTDGMRSISFQVTRARSIRKACSLKCLKGAFDSDEGWSFDRRPITDAGNKAVIAEILVEDTRGVFGGQVGQDDIYERAHVYRFGVVPGRFIDHLCEI